MEAMGRHWRALEGIGSPTVGAHTVRVWRHLPCAATGFRHRITGGLDDLTRQGGR